MFHQAEGRFTYPFWKPTFAVIHLVANNQVVATLRHTTRTDGWTGWSSDPQNGNTQALPRNQIQADGVLKVPLTVRRDQPVDFYSKLVNQRPLGLDADEMDLQVRLKNPFSEGGISCFDPLIGVRWGGRDDRQCLAMQTTRTGCGVDAYICLGDNLFRNGEYDLSGLGANFESWHTLQVTTQKKVATFLLDGKRVFHYTYKQDFGPIQALEVTFKGSGSVDWVRLANSRTGKVVYFEDF